MFVYEIIFPASITINLLTLFHLLLPKIVWYAQGRHREVLTYLFQPVDGKRRPDQEVVAAALIHTTLGVLFISLSIALVVYTDVITRPFTSYGALYALPYATCIGYCVVNLTRMVITNQTNAHECIRNLVCVTILSVVSLTGENALAGILVLALHGSVVADEIKHVAELYDHHVQMYTVVVVAHIFMQSVFLLLAPVVIYIIPCVFTAQSLSDLGSASIICLVIGVLHLVIVNGLKFKRDVFLFLQTYAKLRSIKQHGNKELLSRAIVHKPKELEWAKSIYKNSYITASGQIDDVISVPTNAV